MLLCKEEDLREIRDCACPLDIQDRMIKTKGRFSLDLRSIFTRFSLKFHDFEDRCEKSRFLFILFWQQCYQNFVVKKFVKTPVVVLKGCVELEF